MRIDELLSNANERRLARLLQAAVVGIALYGAWIGRLGVVVNAGIALAVTFLPAVLRRDAAVSPGAGMTLWIAAAMVLHSIGILGPYRTVPWWDQLTHASSASVVAGLGYATVLAFETHSEELRFPAELTFVFVLLFVMAFGVFWEIIEFGTGLAARAYGGEALLAQYGLDDIVFDLAFNQVGAIVVAAWATSRRTGLTGMVRGAGTDWRERG